MAGWQGSETAHLRNARPVDSTLKPSGLTAPRMLAHLHLRVLCRAVPCGAAPPRAMPCATWRQAFFLCNHTRPRTHAPTHHSGC